MRHVRVVDGQSTQFVTNEQGQSGSFAPLAVKTSVCLALAPGRSKEAPVEADVAAKIMPSLAFHNPIRAIPLSEPDPGPNRKLGLEVALKLEEEFLRAGWPAGHLFGLQADIQRRFGIGRWAVREAVRILEMRGSAEMRRGRGGGLMIARPTLENMLKPCALYLLSQQTTHAHLDHAARVLAEIAGEAIAQRYRIHEELALELSVALAESGDLLKALVKMTGNPALALVAAILEVVAGSCSISASAYDPQGIAAISTAILTGQGRSVSELVCGPVSNHLEHAELDLLRWLKPAVSLNACRYSAQLAFKMLGEIMGRAQTGSTFLGSEWEIAEQYNFSLESVRQASRMLEDMGVVECRLGRNGGLFARKPVLAEIVSQAFAYLSHQGITRADALVVAGKMDQDRLSAESFKAAENPILMFLGAVLDAYAHRIKPENSHRTMATIAH
jgi:DNA-binding FadR family transcriptional regulator